MGWSGLWVGGWVGEGGVWLARWRGGDMAADRLATHKVWGAGGVSMGMQGSVGERGGVPGL